MQTASRGRFITFEGVDGAGKSTQIEALAQTLRQHRVAVVRTREPGGTPLGEALRTIMLGQAMDPLTESLLMFAARREHVAQVIEPALAGSQWVLCDRFTDASYAYQGAGRGVPADRLDVLAGWVHGRLQPDLTVLVDIDPDQARQRRAQVRAADRFETESAAFFQAVRSAYLARAAAEPARFLVVDGGAPAPVVTSKILERLSQWLR
ncbi:Thymidylate kinase [Burkholderiales bacterium]|nr:Thymidylate kinase [Burkholderiales bacterium]